jgi:hypothetical protein
VNNGELGLENRYPSSSLGESSALEQSSLGLGEAAPPTELPLPQRVPESTRFLLLEMTSSCHPLDDTPPDLPEYDASSLPPPGVGRRLFASAPPSKEMEPESLLVKASLSLRLSLPLSDAHKKEESRGIGKTSRGVPVRPSALPELDIYHLKPLKIKKPALNIYLLCKILLNIHLHLLCIHLASFLRIFFNLKHLYGQFVKSLLIIFISNLEFSPEAL